jgi:hypothetical protein
MTLRAHREASKHDLTVWWAHQTTRDIKLTTIMGEGFEAPVNPEEDIIMIGDMAFPTARV